MSKVYFVGGLYQGCYYVRCWLPLYHNGWKGNKVGFSTKNVDEKIATQEMKDADIIVFHRADTPQHHRLAIQLKQMGKKIVFDNDDTYQLDELHPFFCIDDIWIR